MRAARAKGSSPIRGKSAEENDERERSNQNDGENATCALLSSLVTAKEVIHSNGLIGRTEDLERRVVILVLLTDLAKGRGQLGFLGDQEERMPHPRKVRYDGNTELLEELGASDA
jgi:hypothetical protein